MVGRLPDQLLPVVGLDQILEVAVYLIDGELNLPLVVELLVRAVEDLGLYHGFSLGQVEGIFDLLREQLMSAVEEMPAEGAVKVLQDIVIHSQQVIHSLYIPQIPLLLQQALLILVLLVDVDPDSDGLLLVVHLLDVLDISPEVNDDGGVWKGQAPDVAGH